MARARRPLTVSDCPPSHGDPACRGRDPVLARVRDDAGRQPAPAARRRVRRWTPVAGRAGRTRCGVTAARRSAPFSALRLTGTAGPMARDRRCRDRRLHGVHRVHRVHRGRAGPGPGRGVPGRAAGPAVAGSAGRPPPPGARPHGRPHRTASAPHGMTRANWVIPRGLDRYRPGAPGAHHGRDRRGPPVLPRRAGLLARRRAGVAPHRADLPLPRPDPGMGAVRVSGEQSASTTCLNLVQRRAQTYEGLWSLGPGESPVARARRSRRARLWP